MIKFVPDNILGYMYRLRATWFYARRSIEGFARRAVALWIITIVKFGLKIRYEVHIR
jgi:hypothetical protein